MIEEHNTELHVVAQGPGAAIATAGAVNGFLAGWTEADREIHNARLIGGELGLTEAGILQDLEREDRYQVPYLAAAHALAVEGITVDAAGARAAVQAILDIRRHQAASQATIREEPRIPTVMGTLGTPLKTQAERAIRNCSRAPGHTGPCNGWPCPDAAALRTLEQELTAPDGSKEYVEGPASVGVGNDSAPCVSCGGVIAPPTPDNRVETDAGPKHKICVERDRRLAQHSIQSEMSTYTGSTELSEAEKGEPQPNNHRSNRPTSAVAALCGILGLLGGGGWTAMLSPHNFEDERVDLTVIDGGLSPLAGIKESVDAHLAEAEESEPEPEEVCRYTWDMLQEREYADVAGGAILEGREWEPDDFKGVGYRDMREMMAELANEQEGCLDQLLVTEDELRAAHADVDDLAGELRQLGAFLVDEWNDEIGLGDPEHGESAVEVAVRLLRRFKQNVGCLRGKCGRMADYCAQCAQEDRERLRQTNNAFKEENGSLRELIERERNDYQAALRTVREERDEARANLSDASRALAEVDKHARTTDAMLARRGTDLENLRQSIADGPYDRSWKDAAQRWEEAHGRAETTVRKQDRELNDLRGSLESVKETNQRQMKTLIAQNKRLFEIRGEVCQHPAEDTVQAIRCLKTCNESHLATINRQIDRLASAHEERLAWKDEAAAQAVQLAELYRGLVCALARLGVIDAGEQFATPEQALAALTTVLEHVQRRLVGIESRQDLIAARQAELEAQRERAGEYRTQAKFLATGIRRVAPAVETLLEVRHLLMAGGVQALSPHLAAYVADLRDLYAPVHAAAGEFLAGDKPQAIAAFVPSEPPVIDGGHPWG